MVSLPDLLPAAEGTRTPLAKIARMATWGSVSDIIAAAISLLAVAIAVIVYWREWTPRLYVVDPQYYWVGYMQHPNMDRVALVVPIHVGNAGGRSVVLSNIVVEVSGPSRFGKSVHLQPEWSVDPSDAGYRWWRRQLFVPLVARGKEIETSLIVFGHRRRAGDRPDLSWCCGQYTIRIWEPEKEKLLASFSFELERLYSKGSREVGAVLIGPDMGFSVRKWTLEALRARDRFRTS